MLRRFLHYRGKVFEFEAKLTLIRDTRQGPQISSPAVWKSVFLLLVLRLGSFNRLVPELRQGGSWRKLLGGRPPSADTLGYSLCRFSLPEMRALVAHHHHRAWRNKAVQGRGGQRRRVVAIDGYELGHSETRRCSECLERKGQKKDREVQAAGKHFVVVLKQERRELYRDTQGLRTPKIIAGNRKSGRIWDLKELR